MKCFTCIKIKSEWYRAMSFSPDLAEQKKRELQEHWRECDEHKEYFRWAASCPPNPELSREELEATRPPANAINLISHKRVD